MSASVHERICTQAHLYASASVRKRIYALA